ncbi:MAG: MurR/RpiR family transcriptional regulator [Solobacterium sp.]|nr:MurR/RpiR family transcriptional regulator [Solobacterium sp.]
MSTITERMQDELQFTDIEKEVIRYILEHMDDVSTMNIGDLAKETYVSNATIIRICRKLECDGFRQLKHELTKDLEAKRYAKNEVDFNTPFGFKQSVPDIIHSLSSLYKETTDITERYLKQGEIRSVAQKLNKAHRIFIFAIGDSMITCEGFANKMIKIGRFVYGASGHGDQMIVAREMKPDDVALFVSYSGESLKECIPILKQNHVPIIGITSTKESAIGKHADELILIPDKENKTFNKISTFYSQVSFSLILDILYSILYALNKK